MLIKTNDDDELIHLQNLLPIKKLLHLIFFLQYSSVVVQLLLKVHYITFNTQYHQKMDQCILF